MVSQLITYYQIFALFSFPQAGVKRGLDFFGGVSIIKIKKYEF